MTTIHCVGIGGIAVSALAKWLVHLGYGVSGSDGVEGPQIQRLRERGVLVSIGANPEHVPPTTELLVYSSAVPEDHPERAEARSRGIQEMNSFELLGELTRDRDVVLIAGTHGKSTTTAMASLALIDGGVDPTCFVGSVVPGFVEGNVRFGQGNHVVIEGDEYDRHFLHFSPKVLVVNNLEWDHTDIFPSYTDLVITFQHLLRRVVPGGVVCFNADDPRVGELIALERVSLQARGIRVQGFGMGVHATTHIRDLVVRDGAQHVVIEEEDGRLTRTKLRIPGKMNVANALAAFCAARAVGISAQSIGRSLEQFSGIWRRFERITDTGGVLVVSDYAHHPTAVRRTIEAARSFFPGRRIVACYQPHQRARTQAFFHEYVASFDGADVLVLAEIWDPAGREAEGIHLSSRDLLREVIARDEQQHLRRTSLFAQDRHEALAQLRGLVRTGDVVLVMGAGDIYLIAPEVWTA